MLGPPVSPERHWNTWDSAHPASLVHLPSGLSLRLAAYSGSAGRYSDFPTARLLEHTADASYVAAEVELAGSRVRLELAKADPFTLGGRLTVLETGEWALRFWLLLELGYPGDDEDDPSAVPTRVRLDAPEDPYTQPALVRARHRSRRACLVPSERPTYAGLYDDLDELREELEEGGYYRPHPEQPGGRWAVLRFNGQSQASDDLRARRGDRRRHRRAAGPRARGRRPGRRARRRGPPRLRAGARGPRRRGLEHHLRRGEPALVHAPDPQLDAVEVRRLGRVARRRALPRAARRRAGDAPTARANLEVALTGQQPEGNLACLLTAYTEWVDRSQPPIGAYVALRVFLLTGDRALLEQAYPTLRRAHDWWFEHRDGNGDGVLEHGSSPTGEGTFVHTKQGAMDEAAMDNLPLFDDAVFDERAHTLDLEEVGLNSLVVLDGQMLARIARCSAAPTRPRRWKSAPTRSPRGCASGCGIRSARCSRRAAGRASSSSRWRRPASIRWWRGSPRRSRPRRSCASTCSTPSASGARARCRRPPTTTRPRRTTSTGAGASGRRSCS